MGQFQSTIKRGVSFSGEGLHTGNLCTVTLAPATPGSGINFIIEGIKIPASYEFVIRTDRSTTVGIDELEVSTIEHLMAAICGLQLDNLTIEVSGSEIPILDGSAYHLSKIILDAGIHTYDIKRDSIDIQEPIHFTSSSGSVYDFRPASSFSIEVRLDYPSPLLKDQSFLFSGFENFLAEMAPARTYCFDYEVRELLNRGLIKGGSLENALVITEDSDPAEWKFNNEPARHKALDLLGDLSLFRKQLNGHLTAFKPGHSSNIEFCRHLSEILSTELSSSLK